LRTRVASSLFTILSIALIFYLNPDSCNANLEIWLGLGPLYVRTGLANLCRYAMSRRKGREPDVHAGRLTPPLPTPLPQFNLTAQIFAEAYLYCPRAPHQSAVKLHSSLQQFAWTEGSAPDVLAKRGYAEDPLFVFETALKSCYFYLHSYRHFRVGDCRLEDSPGLLAERCLFAFLMMPS
jgi:hypothetical protein